MYGLNHSFGQKSLERRWAVWVWVSRLQPTQTAEGLPCSFHIHLPPETTASASPPCPVIDEKPFLRFSCSDRATAEESAFLHAIKWSVAAWGVTLGPWRTRPKPIKSLMWTWWSCRVRDSYLASEAGDVKVEQAKRWENGESGNSLAGKRLANEALSPGKEERIL
ncbi:hypothetical protein SRHO_G00264490 [Serrasalmus rhombeus]